MVPLPQMVQFGVDASFQRVHPRNAGYSIDADGNAIFDADWATTVTQRFGDARDAGFGNDSLSVRDNGAIPGNAFLDPARLSPTMTPTPPDVLAQLPFRREARPLFSEHRDQSFADSDRNPYMMYEPMSRLGSLVTERSNVFAVWITVGYFEVEKAPDWNDPNATVKANVRAKFGATLNDGDAATIAGLALYNRVYPNGYMLGREVGSDTGDVKRPRGFYIIDRTEEVGFKPGEDLNVDRLIRLRRRIE
jgi:hypothetical protein